MAVGVRVSVTTLQTIVTGGNLARNVQRRACQLTLKKLFTMLDKRGFLWYIILMNNDMRSFEVWILISIVLFIATLGFGFYIESI